jgi:hypothetical protein
MRIRQIFFAALAFLMATGCNGQPGGGSGSRQDAGAPTGTEQSNNQAMNKIVIFFSHAGDNYSVGNIEVGNTKIVADYISELTGADQYEIVIHKYDGMAYMPLIDLAKKEA